MDFDLLFSSPRWRILEILARNLSSPVEISQKINTSVAYVSQQLKLLEASGLVVKKRTGQALKGKPRTLFSLSNEILQLTVLMNKLPSRKVIRLTDHHKIILRIWLIENSDLHYYIEKLYWKIEDLLSEVEGIFVKTEGKNLEVLVVSDSKKVKVKLETLSKEIEKIANISFLSVSDFRKRHMDELLSIYDPKNFLNNGEMKGGLDK